MHRDETSTDLEESCTPYLVRCKIAGSLNRSGQQAWRWNWELALEPQESRYREAGNGARGAKTGPMDQAEDAKGETGKGIGKRE
ncbi:hypothetical protein E5D57_008721 [Metarhizium anisopliae]|nr:hypothetical protein E5D57_008721 [Metarhizium anisopliae]